MTDIYTIFLEHDKVKAFKGQSVIARCDITSEIPEKPAIRSYHEHLITVSLDVRRHTAEAPGRYTLY